MNVVECIKLLVEEKSISLYKLAQNAGISQSTLSNLINRGNDPSIFTLKKICEGLGISLSEFFFIMEEHLFSDCLFDEYNELIRTYILLGPKEKEYLHRTMQLLMLHSQETYDKRQKR